MRIAVAQLDYTIGAFDANLEAMTVAVEKARRQAVELVVFTELATEGISQRYAIEMEAIGCDKDHIQLLCGAHPKIAPGRIVQIFKSITAREIFRRKPSVKKELWGGEFWTDGYYVATVGERGNWDTVEKYVQKQGKPKTELQQLKMFE